MEEGRRSGQGGGLGVLARRGAPGRRQGRGERGGSPRQGTPEAIGRVSLEAGLRGTRLRLRLGWHDGWRRPGERHGLVLPSNAGRTRPATRGGRPNRRGPSAQTDRRPGLQDRQVQTVRGKAPERSAGRPAPSAHPVHPRRGGARSRRAAAQARRLLTATDRARVPAQGQPEADRFGVDPARPARGHRAHARRRAGELDRHQPGVAGASRRRHRRGPVRPAPEPVPQGAQRRLLRFRPRLRIRARTSGWIRRRRHSSDDRRGPGRRCAGRDQRHDNDDASGVPPARRGAGGRRRRRRPRSTQGRREGDGRCEPRRRDRGGRWHRQDVQPRPALSARPRRRRQPAGDLVRDLHAQGGGRDGPPRASRPPR